MSDIFRDYSFGGWLRHFRTVRAITLRKMAVTLEMDAGNYSKVERSLLNPPDSRRTVIRLLKPLNLEKSQIDFMCGLALESKLTRCREEFLK